MTDLFNFNEEDILTGITAGKAIVGSKGFFGDSLSALIDEIKRNDVRTLSDINRNCAHCFEVEHKQNYAFFLPADKVKRKEPTYRPLANIDELFDFLLPKFEVVCDEDGNQIEYDAYRKAEILLRQRIILKRKYIDQIKVMTIVDVDFLIGSNDSSNVFLNCFTLDYLFHVYEIKKEGEWVPFGIEVEEQDSKSSKDNSLSDFMDKRIKEISEE